jgi:hypothetical protein
MKIYVKEPFVQSKRGGEGRREQELVEKKPHLKILLKKS